VTGYEVRRATRAGLFPLLAVGTLIIGAVVAASLSTPQIHPAPLPKYSYHPERPTSASDKFLAPGAPHDTGTPATSGIALPGWLGDVLLGVAALFLLAVLGLLIFLLLRNRDRTRAAALPQEAEVTIEQQRARVIAAVDAGLADLDDGDPRAAVIACWVRLEEAAAAAGTPREPGDTPAELVLRLLGEHQVSSGVLYGLAEVYRLARYATHSVDAGMREQARSALHQLRAELTQPADEDDAVVTG
jgi:Domain of unknown function (DUF4129)